MKPCRRRRIFCPGPHCPKARRLPPPLRAVAPANRQKARLAAPAARIEWSARVEPAGAAAQQDTKSAPSRIADAPHQASPARKLDSGLNQRLQQRERGDMSV